MLLKEKIERVKSYRGQGGLMKTLILTFLLLATTCLYSTIINVPADQPTIQEGIEAAADTDTVLVADGTYFENIDFIGKAITVASNFLLNGDTLHIENTVINGSQPTSPDFGSCVMFLSGEDDNSVLTGFYLTEGTGCFAQVIGNNSGGGIYCLDSSPMIVSNIIKNNSLAYGGGITIHNSSPTLLNNVISNNTVTYNCGGVSIVFGSNPYLEGNIISNNTAYAAGGILISDSSPTLVDNVIIGNSVADISGGVHIQYDSNPVFLNNIICNNSGTYAGGLHIVLGAVPTIQNCHIYGNNAGISGGGIRVYEADIDVTGCTISDNYASYGGGINVYNAEIEVINCTISDNHANSNGGGICNGVDSNSSIVNCILWNNTPQEIYVVSGSVTATYSDIQGGWAGTGNIDEDPLFVGTGDNPYSLLEDSPCIDAGDPDTIGSNLLPWDIIGNIRIWDGDGDGIAIIDMGAYEYDAPPYVDVEDNVIIQTPEIFLHQNYPNPFNPTTTINYSLKENSNVSLNIYNIKGQKVKQLVSDQLSAGQHSVVWNGKDDSGKSVSSGIYLYKLKTVNFEKTKKMILIK